jgi:hypothetical protein
MQKLANMRNWSERMQPNFGMSRGPALGVPAPPHGHPKATSQNLAAMGPPQSPGDSPLFYSFIIPLSSELAGPDTEDILHATADAVLRWTHPEDAPDDVPIHELPVHAENLARLTRFCEDITSSAMAVEAYVLSSTPKNGRGQITTVCLSGANSELVYKSRESILNETPILMVSLCRAS